MGISIGKSTSGIRVGAALASEIHVGESGPDIHVGSSGSGIAVGSKKVLAAVLDGVTSHIALPDALAAAAHDNTGHVWHLWLVKATSPGVAHDQVHVGSNDPANNHPYWVATSDAAADGALQVAVVNTVPAIAENFTGSASTRHIDGGWHLNQALDEWTGAAGRINIKTDGSTLQDGGTYTRLAASGFYPAYLTLGARSIGSPKAVASFSAQIRGYYALVVGEPPSQAKMDEVFDAFNTGGGRADPRTITNKLLEIVTTGVVKYAITLDGVSAPHVDPDSVGPPNYEDCAFEPAGYAAREYAYMEAGSYIVASASDQALVAAQFKSAAGPITVIQIKQSDPELGDETVYRESWNVSTNVDTNGSFVMEARDSPGGDYRFYAAGDGGGVLVNSGTAGPVHVDGGLYMHQHVDTATASTAQAKVSQNGAAFVNLSATWDRSALGALTPGWLGLAGGVRGVGPGLISSPLGQVYLTAFIFEDLTADRAALYAAFNTALGDSAQDNMHAACRALMAAIEAAVGDTANIVFAMEFVRGGSPDYGDAPTMVGVTYSEPGVTP